MGEIKDALAITLQWPLLPAFVVQTRRDRVKSITGCGARWFSISFPHRICSVAACAPCTRSIAPIVQQADTLRPIRRMTLNLFYPPIRPSRISRYNISIFEMMAERVRAECLPANVRSGPGTINFRSGGVQKASAFRISPDGAPDSNQVSNESKHPGRSALGSVSAITARFVLIEHLSLRSEGPCQR